MHSEMSHATAIDAFAFNQESKELHHGDSLEKVATTLLDADDDDGKLLLLHA
jgi:hypothetical protein